MSLKRYSSTAISLIVALAMSTVALVQLGPAQSAFATSPTYENGVCDLGAVPTPGDGLSEATAWEISTADQLWEISDCDGQFFRLVSDVYASSASAAPTNSPIGDEDGSSPRDRFIGTLDGDGHSVIFSMSRSDLVGLFNKIDGATIKNLTLKGDLASGAGANVYSGGLAATSVGVNTVSNVVVELGLASRGFLGGFIGQVENNSRVLIENSRFDGELEATGSSSYGHVGGFVGRSIGPLTIRESTSSGNLSISPSVIRVGGFVGIHEADPIELDGLGRSGGITGGSDGVGGIFGVVSATSFATASNLVNFGPIATLANDVGGIGGFFSGKGDFTDVSNSGSVSGGNSTAGILGQSGVASTNVTLDNARNSATVSGASNVAGILAISVGNVTISGSVNSGAISASYAAGGILSEMKTQGTRLALINSENSGNVRTSGSVAAGGLATAGVVLAQAVIQRFTNSGQVTATNHNMGGVAGWVYAPISIEDSSNTATISAGGSGVGGAIGHLRPQPNTVTTISGFTNFGQIGGSNYVSGLVGEVAAAGVNSRLNIRSSSNRAAVVKIGNASNANVGGVVGWARIFSGDLNIQIQESVNSGDLDGNNRPNVGGLVGYADTAVTLLVSEAFSSGFIGGSTSVGGLVGRATVRTSISNSYSVATISGTSAVSGLVGSGPTLLEVENSYFAGSLIANAVDGIASGNQGATITSSYTLTTSQFVSASTEVELRTLATFQNWDFDDIWSFGACDINNQLPVLQWAEQIYFDLSCLQVQAPSQSTQSVAISQPAIPAPSYDGPMVIDTPIEATLGALAIVSGTKLESVYEVEINGVVLEVSSASATSVTFQIPEAFELGLFDLVLYSSFGKLTVIDGIRVSSSGISPEDAFGELLGYRWVSKFDGNLRSLSPAQAGGIEGSLLAQPETTTVVCWGYTTAEMPKQWAIDHASKRAEATCEEVRKLNPELITHVRIRSGVSKFAANRTSLQFWELKPAP